MNNEKKHIEEMEDIREMLDVFTPHKLLTESQVIKLVEERGVWPAPYKQRIENVLNKYVGNYVQNRTNPYTIQIPSEEWRFINEVEKLEVVIELYLVGPNFDPSDWGSGKNRVKNNGKLTQEGKLDYGMIVIYGGYLPNGQILKKAVYNNIYHEMHHLLNVRNDLLRTRDNNSTVRDTDIANVTFNMYNVGNWIDVNFEGNEADWLKAFIYRLFNYTEVNAIISGVYGDLKGMNSIRQNFQNDIKYTQAYQTYIRFKNNYNTVIDDIPEDKVVEFYNVLNSLGFAVNTKVKTPTNCRYMLKRTIRHYLDKFINRIGGAASYYYDSIEEVKRINEIEGICKDGYLTIE